MSGKFLQTPPVKRRRRHCVIGSSTRSIYVTNVEGKVDRYRPNEGVVRFLQDPRRAQVRSIRA